MDKTWHKTHNKSKIPLGKNRESWKLFEKTENWWICEKNSERNQDLDCRICKNVVHKDKTLKNFKEKTLCKKQKVIKVKDHDHITGYFRGAAHVVRNLKTRCSYTHFLSMVLQNMSRLDSHLFLRKQFRQRSKNMKFKVKPGTHEEYCSFTNGPIGIFDSS